jgi:hypothetical protein
VHVQIQDRESKAKFVFGEEKIILLFKKVRGKKPHTNKEANEISLFLKEYHEKIIEKWNKVLVYHQKVNCEVVKQKIRQKKI